MKVIVSALLILLVFSCNSDIENEQTNKAGKGVINLDRIPVIDSVYVASKATHFKVSNNVIEGEGLAILKKMIKESQFISYGESHGSKETSKFISALMPLLAEGEYKHFAIEVGPSSAKKLEKLSMLSQNTIANLRTFNAKYQYPEKEIKSIPFFTGVEDAEFLKSSSEYGMKLWGLDQEFFQSIFFHLDDLLILAKTKDNYNAIKEKKVKAEEYMHNWFVTKSNKTENIMETFNNLVTEDFFNHFNEDDTEANKIISDLKISWDIFARWRNDSHVDRISYMRNNFMKNYHEATKQEQLPKVFLKFGSAHVRKIISNGAYDLGYFVDEIASKNGTTATNINSWRRYYVRSSGEEVDFLKEYPQSFKRFTLFMCFAKKDAWTIVDLKSIRDDVKKGIIELPANGDFHKIKALIEGYDYQFILPEDTPVTLNLE